VTPAADVVVVGGGPAGASTAFQLARAGVRVTLLERSRFPRLKPCAECLSPQASRVLEDMGVLERLERAGSLLRGMAVRAPDGTWMRGDYAATHGYRGHRDRGLAIRRDILDDVVLSRARDAGVEVVEDARVTGVTLDARERANGVTVLDRSGASRRVAASVVVGADGLRSLVARRLGLARVHRWPRRLSLVAHYHGVQQVGDYGEMHVERDGFVGIADIGSGVTTVAAVFPEAQARAISRGGGRERFLDAWLRSRPQLADRFHGAAPADRAWAVGPFASRARRAWHPGGGAVLVGDAADFFDPFTGEGIYAALRGGELAAAAIRSALGAASERDVLEAWQGYESARRREFAGKWRVERIIGTCVAFPAVVSRAVRSLSTHKELADLLVGVTGDFVPATEVLRASYLVRVFLAGRRAASATRIV
jgi:geranylgeranyl reductase family protein